LRSASRWRFEYIGQFENSLFVNWEDVSVGRAHGHPEIFWTVEEIVDLDLAGWRPPFHLEELTRDLLDTRFELWSGEWAESGRGIIAFDLIINEQTMVRVNGSGVTPDEIWPLVVALQNIGG